MRRTVVYLVALLMPVAFGCRGPWSTQIGSLEPVAHRQQLVAEESAAAPNMAATAGSASLAIGSEESPPRKPFAAPQVSAEQVALAAVLDGLTELGALDPAEKQLLMADLREAQPENWPMIVRHFRSTLAYRQQIAERDAALERVSAERSTDAATVVPATASVVAMSTKHQSNADTTEDRSADESPRAVAVSFDVQQTSPRDARQPPADRLRPSETTQPVEKPLPLKLSNVPLQAISARPHTVNHNGEQATSVIRAVDRPNSLQAAVEELQAQVQPSPGSTDEVHEHMRLRLLQLLAGDQEAALGPIPGATAPQQDYWNKQLFAVSTFLDNVQQPDDKRRAAGSLVHLDQARAKLAELATMQVHKLVFVDSVEGYGAYQLHEAAEFHPGDQVNLYAEIENFSSESTPSGYRTRLGTSYEVLDKNGKRIDSAQFPDVEDLCQNPRRDFHMQYTVTLPKRVYPEQYELRLIITDLQSQKIGQASVPFEIIE